MALQIMTNIKVDFYDKKYILINAKQFDKKSRLLSISCYNHGEPCSLNEGEHSAYVRLRKADNNSVFNSCSIDRKGKIIVELTEQMLSANGICCADLVIVNEGGAKVDSQTGEIVGIENTSVLSTMPIHIDVTEVAADNANIESTYEFNGFNAALEKAEAEYTEVMKTSKSWAVGDTGIRDGEDTDNAKYYSQQSLNSASDANTSALNAAESERVAGVYKDNAFAYSMNAHEYKTEAKNYMDSAKESEEKAANSEALAAMSRTKASISEANAAISEANAKTSEINAANYKEIVENINNSIIGSINTLASNGNIGSFIFIGAITFEDFASLTDDKKATGYVYCITDDFITDDSFVNGAGKTYTAGTNVYYTANGQWDCFGGTASPTATISEVKDYLGI